MAISNVQIANRALSKTGTPRIESLTQAGSANARTMNAAYEITRNAELRRYQWSFAVKRDSVAADGDDPVWGDYNRFSLPNDFISLIRDDESGLRTDWKVEGGFIITRDSAPLDIKYIARIEDPNLFDALFVEAFACKLALETCQEITQSTSKKSDLKQDYVFAISEARRVGAIEKGVIDFPEDDFITAMR